VCPRDDAGILLLPVAKLFVISFFRSARSLFVAVRALHLAANMAIFG